MKERSFIFIVVLIACLTTCCISNTQKQDEMTEEKRIPVILDTDANNELDDQHAIAYLLFNQDYFDVRGITVNETYNGGSIEKHVEEAQRVVDLCGYNGQVRVIPGA